MATKLLVVTINSNKGVFYSWKIDFWPAFCRQNSSLYDALLYLSLPSTCFGTLNLKWKKFKSKCFNFESLRNSRRMERQWRRVVGKSGERGITGAVLHLFARSDRSEEGKYRMHRKLGGKIRGPTALRRRRVNDGWGKDGRFIVRRISAAELRRNIPGWF